MVLNAISEPVVEHVFYLSVAEIEGSQREICHLRQRRDKRRFQA